MNNRAPKTLEKAEPARRRARGEDRKSAEQFLSAQKAVLCLQRTAGNQAVTSLLAGSGGRPLDAQTRGEMQLRFGTDFADVQIHTDEKAATAALSVGARAVTTGRDIAFAPDFFAPHTSEGRLLLAHELAHVVQQRRGQGQSSTSSAEIDARHASTQVATAQHATVQASAPGSAQCDPMTDEEKRRKQSELMLPTGLVNSLQKSGIIPPEQQPAPPAKLESVDIVAPGLGQYLRQIGIRPAAPQAKPAPKLRPAAKSQPQPQKKESLEELESQLFNPLNPNSKQNLMKAIGALGGRSLNIDVVSYGDLMREYYRLKNGAGAPQLDPNLQELGPAKLGGISLAEIERRQHLQWENLDRFEHEPGAWIASGAFITGKSPDEASQALDTAQTLTGLAQSAGAIGEARAFNQQLSNSPVPPTETTTSIDSERSANDFPLQNVPGGIQTPANDVEPPEESNVIPGPLSAPVASGGGAGGPTGPRFTRLPTIGQPPSPQMSAKEEQRLPEGTHKVTTTTRPRTQSLTDEQMMRANMEKAGRPVPEGHDAHHLVPKQGGGIWGNVARRRLQRAGLSINDADNGIALPGSSTERGNVAEPEGGPYHGTIHTEAYYKEIATRMSTARGKASARAILRGIAEDVRNGSFPH